MQFCNSSFGPHFILFIPFFGTASSLSKILFARHSSKPPKQVTVAKPLSLAYYYPAKSLSLSLTQKLSFDRPPRLSHFYDPYPYLFPLQLCFFPKLPSMTSVHCSALRSEVESISMYEALGGICCSILLEHSVRIYA